MFRMRSLTRRHRAAILGNAAGILGQTAWPLKKHAREAACHLQPRSEPYRKADPKMSFDPAIVLDESTEFVNAPGTGADSNRSLLRTIARTRLRIKVAGLATRTQPSLGLLGSTIPSSIIGEPERSEGPPSLLTS